MVKFKWGDKKLGRRVKIFYCYLLGKVVKEKA